MASSVAAVPAAAGACLRHGGQGDGGGHDGGAERPDEAGRENSIIFRSPSLRIHHEAMGVVLGVPHAAPRPGADQRATHPAASPPAAGGASKWRTIWAKLA